jgi:hypothetical protein
MHLRLLLDTRDLDYFLISRYLALSALFLFGATLAFGTPQFTAAKHFLLGTVLDPSLSNVVGAEVELTGAYGSALSSTTRSCSGVFSFGNLAPGKYHVLVRAPGFKDSKSDVTIGSKPLPPLRVVLVIAA